MQKPIIYVAISSIVVFTFCTNYSSNKTDNTNSSKYINIEKANWLLGNWQNSSTDGKYHENWEKKNDSTLIGSSYFIVGNDTVSSECISLEERGYEMFYIPIVKNQNDEKPIIFTLTSLNNSQLVFENPNHDFPQKITYSQVTSDSLVAVISGLVKGKEKSQNFPMTRAK